VHRQSPGGLKSQLQVRNCTCCGSMAAPLRFGISHLHFCVQTQAINENGPWTNPPECVHVCALCGMLKKLLEQ
jgi:hypothetical protein